MDESGIIVIAAILAASPRDEHAVLRTFRKLIKTLKREFPESDI